MRRILAGCVMVVLGAAPAGAEIRPALGASVNFMKPRESALEGTRTSVTPTIGIAPTRGIGLTYGLNWFEQRIDLQNLGGPVAEGDLHIRPIMLGVSYTFGGENTMLSVSTVAGYSFNRLKIRDETRQTPGEISIDNATAIRPGVRLWQSLHRHFGLSFFGGYVFTRPKLTVDGVERKLKGDYAVFSAGGAYVF